MYEDYGKNEENKEQVVMTAEDEQIEEMGFVKRTIGMIFYPTKVFQYLEKKPKILAPILALAVIMLLGAGVFARPYTEALLNQATEMGQAMPEGSGINRIIMVTAIVTIVMMPVMLVGAAAISSLYYWLCSVIFKGKASYLQIFSALLHSKIIMSIGSVIGFALIGLTKDIYMGQTTSLVSFLPKENILSFLGGFLGQVELFNIWGMVVFTLGYAQMTKFSKAKAAIFVIVAFLVVACGQGAITFLNAKIMENSMMY